MLALPLALTAQSPPADGATVGVGFGGISRRCCNRMTAFGVGSQTGVGPLLGGPEIPSSRISFVTSTHTGGLALVCSSILMKPRWSDAPAVPAAVGFSSAPVEIIVLVPGADGKPVQPVSLGVVSYPVQVKAPPSTPCSQKDVGANAAVLTTFIVPASATVQAPASVVVTGTEAVPLGVSLPFGTNAVTAVPLGMVAIGIGRQPVKDVGVRPVHVLF